MRTMRRALANLALAFGELAGFATLMFGMFQRDMPFIAGGGLLTLICIACGIRELLEDGR